MSKIIIALFISISFIIYYIINIPSGENNTSELINTSYTPIQTNIMGIPSISKTYGDNKYSIMPIATYKISALILSKEAYYFDSNNDLSKYDLVLGWGDITIPENLKYIHISQYNRWYYYSAKSGSPLSLPYIAQHSSNHHIIHSNENILKAIKSLKKGDKVILEGFLVNINLNNGRNTFVWNSSLSRNDTQNGSCEVFYVKKVTTAKKIFE